MKGFFLLLALLPQLSFSQINVKYNTDKGKNYFKLTSKTETATIAYDASENVLVHKSARFLSDDIERITGKRPVVTTAENVQANCIIIVATVGKNAMIDKLVAEKKLNVDGLKGQWERFIIKTIDKPFPGIKQALVVVGSDRRGTAYGVFTLSEKMGVSPWYWWADTPIETHNEIYIENCNYLSNSPAVKFRGIFINDESPAFRHWAKEKFGGINHSCY